MKWEYATVKFATPPSGLQPHLDDKALHQTLNYYGWEGWELVSTNQLCGGPVGMTQELVLIFKRPSSGAPSSPAK